MLFTSFVQAQENLSVSEKNISATISTADEAAKALVYPCKIQMDTNAQHSHFVNVITTSKATEICGEKFSTNYFNEQYDKLALLKRCELSLKTVPLAIWNLDKYVEAGISLPYSELGINKLEEVKSYLAVDSFGKRKVITVSHLYKQNRKLFALNTSLVSENDKLFALTTYVVDDKVFEQKDDGEKEPIPEIIKRMQAKEEEKVSNVVPADLEPEARKKIWDEHISFVKKFKPSKFEKSIKK